MPLRRKMSAAIIGKERFAAMEKEAKDLLKKAKGLTAPSLLELRFKPDWEAAAPLLDKAALLYKVRPDMCGVHGICVGAGAPLRNPSRAPGSSWVAWLRRLPGILPHSRSA